MSYYVNGNTVRELESPVRRDRRSREEIEEQKRRRRRQNAARRNRARALNMSKGYVLFLTVCVIAVAVSAVMLVQLQSDVSARMRRVSALQSEVNNQRTENDTRYKHIITSVDLNHIKDVAMNELGMCYPTESQVVYYSVENNNFMDQYSDIPK